MITWALATHCLTNNEGVVRGRGWCIGGWVGVIDNLSVGLRHLGACVQSVEKVLWEEHM